MPLGEITLFLRCFCSVKGENHPKTSLFTLLFSERVDNTAFCDVFSTRGFNVLQIPRFSSFFTSSSQSKPAKNAGICSVLTRQHAKQHDVLKQFFTIFQLMLLHSKNDHFFLYFCHRSSRLNQALIWLTCVSASGKTRPFAPTVRADFLSVVLWSLDPFGPPPIALSATRVVELVCPGGGSVPSPQPPLQDKPPTMMVLFIVCCLWLLVVVVGCGCWLWSLVVVVGWVVGCGCWLWSLVMVVGCGCWFWFW